MAIVPCLSAGLRPASQAVHKREDRLI